MIIDYLKERGFKVVEIDGVGFASYEEQKDHLGQRVMYIGDIFIKPIYRTKGIASELADKVAEIAIKEGIKYLLGSTNLNRPDPELSFKALMGYGMKVHSYSPEGMVYWIKEI